MITEMIKWPLTVGSVFFGWKFGKLHLQIPSILECIWLCCTFSSWALQLPFGIIRNIYLTVIEFLIPVILTYCGRELDTNNYQEEGIAICLGRISWKLERWSERTFVFQHGDQWATLGPVNTDLIVIGTVWDHELLRATFSYKSSSWMWHSVLKYLRSNISFQMLLCNHNF